MLDSGTCGVQSFCWLCGESTGREHTWTQISNHSCGRYKEELDRKIDEAQRCVCLYVKMCRVPHTHKHTKRERESEREREGGVEGEGDAASTCV